MKKNIFLFFILIFLLGITYFVEEIRDVEHNKTSLLDRQLFSHISTETLNSLTISDLNISAKDGKFVIRELGKGVIAEQIETYIKKLHKIHIKRNINLDELPIEFKTPNYWSQCLMVNKSKFCLGKKVSFDQTFYGKVEERGKVSYYILNFDEVSNKVMAKEDIHRSNEKLMMVKTLLNLKASYFLDLRVYPKTMAVDNIKISNIRNKAFTVNLRDKKTIPESLLGRYNTVKIEELSSNLYNLRGDELFILEDKSDLKDRVSLIELFNNKKNTSTLEVYKKHKDTEGVFVRVSGKNDIFKVSKESMEFAYYNAQDLWDKRPFYDSGNVTMKIIFSKNRSLSCKFKIERDLKLDNCSKKYGVIIPSEFLKVFAFFNFNSEYVVKSNKKLSLRDHVFDIRYNKSNFSVYHAKSTLYILDLDKGVSYVYNIGKSLPFSSVITEYLNR